ncbi:hypothetical protein E4U55_000994 [Claviceps digitariae]|nr:hypothetical protein E4U55_000994 [Claviceps digitariae]
MPSRLNHQGKLCEKIIPYCVPDGGPGNCVVADRGKVKTIKCAADKTCPNPRKGEEPKRGRCDWRGGFALCGAQK